MPGFSAFLLLFLLRFGLFSGRNLLLVYLGSERFLSLIPVIPAEVRMCSLCRTAFCSGFPYRIIGVYEREEEQHPRVNNGKRSNTEG